MGASLTDALFAVHDVLAAAEIPHALCGGLAANLYREEVRATVDVDVAVAIGPARVVDLVQKFEDEGWKVAAYWRQGEQLRLTRDDLPRVACVLATTDYERKAIDQAVPARIEGHEVTVLRPEDLIIFKLVAGRARDYEAVAAIINARGEKLDVDYITGWLEQFGVAERWDRAKEEARFRLLAVESEESREDVRDFYVALHPGLHTLSPQRLGPPVELLSSFAHRLGKGSSGSEF